MNFCGKVEHPNVCWAPDSKSVEFISHKRLNADMMIGYHRLDKWKICLRKSE